MKHVLCQIHFSTMSVKIYTCFFCLFSWNMHPKRTLVKLKTKHHHYMQPQMEFFNAEIPYNKQTNKFTRCQYEFAIASEQQKIQNTNLYFNFWAYVFRLSLLEFLWNGGCFFFTVNGPYFKVEIFFCYFAMKFWAKVFVVQTFMFVYV